MNRISRRTFLRLAGAAGACCAACAAGAGVGYGIEGRTLPAPLGDEAAYLGPAAPAAPAPLLLLTSPHADGAFGPYLGAILRAEGLFAHSALALTALSPSALAERSVVLLGPGPVSADQAALLRDFVRGGGGLVAIRPDPQLDDLLGIRHAGGSGSGALLLRPKHPLARGIDGGPLQVHAPIAAIAVAGAEVVGTTADGAPAVTLARYGAGLAAAWAYDLGQNIALTRQGNPAWANSERDDLDGIRAADMFQGWIDLDRIGVPQADEQQRLLAKLIAAVSPAPLPRLWYLPGQAQALLVLTGDGHGSYRPIVEDVLGRIERFGGTMSVYYTPPPADTARRMLRKARWWAGDLPVVGAAFDDDSGLPTPNDVAGWRARGHEFGMHPYVEDGLAAGYNRYWNDFVKLGYGPLPPSVRTHRILWHGWTDTAHEQARYGIGMNLDHYHAGAAVRRPDRSFTYGFLTGSGLPMPFVDADGRLLSVYQQQTHLVDEQMMNVFDDGVSADLDGDTAFAISAALLRSSLERYPAALGVQCHLDPFTFGGAKAANVGRWLERTLELAAGANMPIRSAERWLGFTRQRAAAQASAWRWDAATNQLSVTLQVPAGEALPLLLPQAHRGRPLRSIQIDGAEAGARERTVGGVGYAGVEVPPGPHLISVMYG